jgi:TRAP transporter 4TM/12TM fusion protein
MSASPHVPLEDLPRVQLPTAIFAIAVVFSSFQIYTAAYSPLASQIVRALHVGFVLLLVFSLHPTFRPGAAGPWRLLGYAMGALGFALAFYHWIFEADLIARAGDPTTLDLVVGTVTVLLVFEAARRVMGNALPIICALFVGYALFGHLLPAPLTHRGYAYEQVVDQLAFGTEGIYGIPTYVSSTYIFLFILFGSFLEQAGMIRLFTDFAMGTVGHTRGGPAKVSVVSSGLMGTINGSGVANVVTTGQFTIPLMKRFGYRAEFAGGVEATSSMGGQIMPPVMGAVAFIMAETLNVPYVQICIAALIPALLYFATAFWMVHLEAGLARLLGLPKEECPDAWAAVKRDWFLIVPLAALVTFLFSGYTPLFAGMIGLTLTAVLIFGRSVSLQLSATTWRIVFWVALGIACAGFVRWGVSALFWVIAALVAVNLVIAGGRETLRQALFAMADGARHALPVAIACALVGTIIGVLTLTGAATLLAGYIIRLGEQSLFLSLVLTMLVCLVLGMGIPTIPNYIITSSLAAPALLELGVPLIVSHMFVFYFGIMADLTPPVALACFAASPIARAPGLKISFQAIRVAIAGFVVPYMAVYAPALMLQAGDWVDVGYIVLKALIAIGLWGAAAFSLVLALPITDEIGLGLGLLVIVFHGLRARRISSVGRSA